MTTQEIANEILNLSWEEVDEVMEHIYDSVNTVEYNTDLLEIGIDVSGWCKKKHPPVG